MSESKWTFTPNLKKVPQRVKEISPHKNGTNLFRNEWTTQKHNGHGYCWHGGMGGCSQYAQSDNWYMSGQRCQGESLWSIQNTNGSSTEENEYT